MSNATDQHYITTRIIDACLREDLRGIASRGSAATPDAALLAHWAAPQPPTQWWRITHLPDGTVWLPIHHGGYLQRISACSDRWLVQRGTAV